MPASTQSSALDLSKHPDIVDMSVFEQILEMDDDPDDREFSREIVVGFFEQAETTMEDMQKKIQEQAMKALSDYGHFLKGSSATLGLVKVQKTCEKIQHFGAGLDATGLNREPDERKSLSNIQNSLDDLNVEYAEAKLLLTRYFALDD